MEIISRPDPAPTTTGTNSASRTTTVVVLQQEGEEQLEQQQDIVDFYYGGGGGGGAAAGGCSVGGGGGRLAVAFLSKRLEAEIRAAKRTHLSAGEVLLPCGLLQKIAGDVLAIADTEPKGWRACTVHLLYEGEEDCRRLANFTIDPTTPSTCEIYVTFKQALHAGWTFLPQFLKKIMTKNGTVVISTDYEITRKKLYRRNE